MAFVNLNTTGHRESITAPGLLGDPELVRDLIITFRDRL